MIAVLSDQPWWRCLDAARVAQVVPVVTSATGLTAAPLVTHPSTAEVVGDAASAPSSASGER